MKHFRIGSFKGIALGAGVSRAYVRNLVAGLHGGASAAVAQKLVNAAKLEGFDTELSDWAFPLDSTNPLFVEYRLNGGIK